MTNQKLLNTYNKFRKDFDKLAQIEAFKYHVLFLQCKKSFDQFSKQFESDLNSNNSNSNQNVNNNNNSIEDKLADIDVDKLLDSIDIENNDNSDETENWL